MAVVWTLACIISEVCLYRNLTTITQTHAYQRVTLSSLSLCLFKIKSQRCNMQNKIDVNSTWWHLAAFTNLEKSTMLLFYFREFSQLFGTNRLHWDIFGWKWQKSSLNWPKQTNKKGIYWHVQWKSSRGSAPVTAGIQVIRWQEETHFCFLVLGSIFRMLSPSGDGDGHLLSPISLIIPVEKELFFPSSVIKGLRARAFPATAWSHMPPSNSISAPWEHGLLIGQAWVTCQTLGPISIVWRRLATWSKSGRVAEDKCGAVTHMEGP